MEKQNHLDLESFHLWVEEFCRQQAISLNKKTILLLAGEPGAGKTEFVRALVQYLHPAGLHAEDSSQVASPTFALHHSYHFSGGDMEHWDLYRLSNEDELESTGFWDHFSDSHYLMAIEWPERLQLSWLPRDAQIFHIEIFKQGEGLRSLQVQKK